MAGHPDGRPRNEQIAADLRARIMGGDLKPGIQLPSTQQFMDQYRASNTSVTSALAALKEEGFITSRIGKGVYVRDPQSFVVRVGAYFSPSPRGYAYKLLDVGEVEPPDRVATVYGLGSEGSVVLRHRLMTHDGEPVELSWSYYPVDIARDTPLAGKSKVIGGAPQVLSDLGYTQAYLVDRVSARAPTTGELEALNMPDNVPVLRQFRVVYTEEHRPVEVTIGVKGAHLYELEYRETIESLDG